MTHFEYLGPFFDIIPNSAQFSRVRELARAEARRRVRARSFPSPEQRLRSSLEKDDPHER
jgi:hypothetical protein